MIFPLGLLLVASMASLGESYMKVCYHTNWSQYRGAEMKFFPEDIDGSLCSHIVYAFATMSGNRIKAFETNDESDGGLKGMYERTIDLKVKWPHLKVLLAVGGWNFGTKMMTDMLATKANRNEFVTTAIEFLKKRRFDGLSLDYEYPGSRGSPAGDKAKFALLCEELKAAFASKNLMLAVAVGGVKATIDAGYDIPKISKAVDFISLKTYDLNGAWNTWTAHHSPLFPRSSETGDNRYLNMKFAADYLVSLGASKSKMLIGLALFGRTMQLKDENQNGYDAPIVGPAMAGSWTREKGIWSYYEVCKKISDEGYKRVWNGEHEVPYAYGGVGWQNGWVSYDDIHSLYGKIDWLKSEGYEGIMAWAMDLDDFSGAHCGYGKYPLMTAINKRLGERIPTSAVPPSTTTLPPGVSTTPPPTRPPTTPPSEASCHTECRTKPNGPIPYPHPDVKHFYCLCHNKKGQLVPCPAGTIYIHSKLRCGWPHERFLI